MNTTTIQIQMVNMECSGCGIQYTVTEQFHHKKKEDGTNWNCPAGCSQYYSKSDLSKALEKVKELEKDYTYMKNSRDGYRNSYEMVERTARSYKGHFTRMKNRYEPTETEQ